jgi:acyl dehydratase
MGGRVSTIEQLAAIVGQEIGVGEWLEVTQARIDAFAEVTGDHQWIHVDPERCRKEGRGGTIAHGYLTLSLITKLRQRLQGNVIEIPIEMGVNYGSDRIRFVTPVPAGARIRVRAMLVGLDLVSPDVWQAKYRHTIEIENEAKPALVADTLNRMYLRVADCYSESGTGSV